MYSKEDLEILKLVQERGHKEGKYNLKEVMDKLGFTDEDLEKTPDEFLN